MSQVSDEELPTAAPVLKRTVAEDVKDAPESVSKKRKSEDGEEAPAKKKRITKKGTEDRRAETSLINGAKGREIVKKAVERLKLGDAAYDNELKKRMDDMKEKEETLKQKEKEHKAVVEAHRKEKLEHEKNKSVLYSNTLAHVAESRRKMLIKQ